MTGARPGVNDWYLIREGRWDSSDGDDDPHDRNPDTWLDQLTGPAAQSGRRRLSKSLGQRSSTTSGASRRASSGVGSSADRDLARDAVVMNRQANYSLSFADVVRRMQAAGRQVTKADIQRAIRATNTQWGRPPKSSGPTTSQDRTTVRATSTAHVARAHNEPFGNAAEAVRTVLAASPKMPATKVVQLLRAKGYHVSETDVLAIRLEPATGARPSQSVGANSPRARGAHHGSREPSPKAGDAALALAATRLNRTASRTLSYREAVRLLRANGWDVSVAELRRAIDKTNTRWSNPQRPGKSGRAARTSSRNLLRAAPTGSVAICDSCGVAVSADGHCACS